MQKKLTITVDEDVYEGLYKVIGRRHISQFIEDLVRPHVINADLETGYQAMAADETREAEALQWTHSFAQMSADERIITQGACPELVEGPGVRAMHQGI